MQRWTLILAAYQFDIQYNKLEKHSNADALSSKELDLAGEAEVLQSSNVTEVPVEAKQVSEATTKV